MRQHAVGQRCLEWTAEDRIPDDRRHFLAAVGACEGDCRPARGQLGARDHRGDGVEHVPFRLLENVAGQHPIARMTHVLAEPGHDVADWKLAGDRPDWLRCSPLRLRGLHDLCRKCGGRDDQPRAPQHAAPGKERAVLCGRARVSMTGHDFPYQAPENRPF